VHPLASALHRLGTSSEEVRTEIVARMLALARGGDFGALRFLGERLLPRGRALENIFDGVPANSEARLAALVEHVGRGTLSPEEAQEVAEVVRVHAEAELWSKLRDRLASLEVGNVGGADGSIATTQGIVTSIEGRRGSQE